MREVHESPQPLCWGLKALAVLIAVTLGLPLLLGDIYLITLGGSWYYALAGAAYTYAAVELFSGRMRSGRQFIAITAGGARYYPNDRSDYILAFALPDSTKR